MRIPNSEDVKGFTLPKIGMRNIKTTIAVFACFALYDMFGRDVVTFAAIAAFICMQDNVTKSIQDGINRILGTVLGGAFGVVILSLYHMHNIKALLHITTAIGVSLLIYLGVLLRKKESIPISCFVFLMLATNLEITDPLATSVNRVIDTIIGIAIAITVNKLLFEPVVPEEIELEKEAERNRQELEEIMRRE